MPAPQGEDRAAAASAGMPPYRAGLQPFLLEDPVEGGPMPSVLYYPTLDAPGSLRKGFYELDARQGAAPAPGKFPLILFSHGTGGSLYGHHDSLTHLARQGMLAAAALHPRDNFLDQTGFGTDLQYVGRAHHVVTLLEHLLAHEAHALSIDAARIGVAGFSAGGFTAIVLLGGRPDFTRLDDYCRAHPDDRVMCSRAPARRLKPGLDYIAEPRVKAAFLMAPALGFLFEREDLAAVTAPVRIYRAGDDELLREPYASERYRALLPNAPEYEIVEGAGHYIFLAPCSEKLRQALPAVCADPPGIDRAAFHRRLNGEMVAFFRRTLGVV
jgi:predicted dienelactone hydrolase